jgi:hypothetical protein
MVRPQVTLNIGYFAASNSAFEIIKIIFPPPMTISIAWLDVSPP